MMAESRDTYIDFLRSVGLILLIGVHVNAPEWYVPMRSFDVPLMVFVSALCYKPLRGGYLAYLVKRFKRIYIPVALFLTLLVVATIGLYAIKGKLYFSVGQIVGSFLLLNYPSIGYVWIMRIFLMMALLLPALDTVLKKLNFTVFLTLLVGIIVGQSFMIDVVEMVQNKYIRFAIDETVLYAIGYTPIAIVGLRLRSLNVKESVSLTILTGTLIILFIGLNDWSFDPQTFKYPPQSLYILYGIFGSTLFWSLRGIVGKCTKQGIFLYLSENSMWIYLWHIIPVYAVTRWNEVHGFWFGRFCIVIAVALLLNLIYQRIIINLPSRVYKLVK